MILIDDPLRIEETGLQFLKENSTLMEIAGKMDMEWWIVTEVFKKDGIKRKVLLLGKGGDPCGRST